jgi:hypothetical protein
LPDRLDQTSPLGLTQQLPNSGTGYPHRGCDCLGTNWPLALLGIEVSQQSKGYFSRILAANVNASEVDNIL